MAAPTIRIFFNRSIRENVEVSSFASGTSVGDTTSGKVSSVFKEASVDGVLTTLKLIGDDKKAVLLLDKDLATRTFVAPVIG